MGSTEQPHLSSGEGEQSGARLGLPGAVGERESRSSRARGAGNGSPTCFQGCAHVGPLMRMQEGLKEKKWRPAQGWRKPQERDHGTSPEPGPPQQPGPVHHSGTHCPFPDSSIRVGLQHSVAPGAAREPRGRLWVSHTSAVSLSPQGGAEGGAGFQSPRLCHFKF